MSLKIKAKIDVKKILKEHLYAGKKGKYLDVVFFENDDGPDEYGQDGFVKQELSKEARDRGEKGPIIGNWSYFKPKSEKQKAPAAAAAPGTPPPEEDDVPF